ncbi:hypothetical protein PF003_g1236 [Phytophthora fragariae]|nr:hypothetical protein PF003_g1236 [Phytophthora fragariae]
MCRQACTFDIMMCVWIVSIGDTGVAYGCSAVSASFPRFDRLRNFSAALDRLPGTIFGSPARKPTAATFAVGVLAGTATTGVLSATLPLLGPLASFVTPARDDDPTSFAVDTRRSQKCSV